MNLQELLAARARAWDAANEIRQRSLDEKRPMTAEERQSFDAATAEVRQHTEEINRANELLQLEGSMQRVAELEGAPGNAPTEGEAQYRDTFLRFIRGGVVALNADEQRMLHENMEALPAEARALGVGSGSAGGYSVPPAFRNKIVEAEKTFGNVEAVAEVITTDTGVDLPWPTNDDTGNMGVIVGENVANAEQDIVLGTDSIKAYMYSSKLVRASLQFIQDSGIDAEEWLSRKFAERIARIKNVHYTVGSGTNQPEGLVTGGTVGATAASTTVVTYADFVRLMVSVDAAFRGRSKWMFGDAVLQQLFLLVDADSRPLWVPSVREGQPDTLLGKPIVSNPDMPTPAASAKTVAFGDFQSGYLVRNVRGFQMMRLAERYAEYFQVGFIGFSRSDGAVQNAQAYKVLAQAAS